jgi:hypothetical protein
MRPLSVGDYEKGIVALSTGNIYRIYKILETLAPYLKLYLILDFRLC